MQWSINVFSHNFWNSPWTSIAWLVRISIGALNLLSNLSKNAYATPLLWSCNGTNSNHLEKCSIISKTYWLCRNVKFNGPATSKLHQYPSPIIGKGYRWGVGALKDARIQSHTIHLETKCWICNCIPCHEYYVGNKLYVHRTPKWPNSPWACLIRLSHCYGRSTTFTCPSTHIHRVESPSHLNHLAICTTWSLFLGVNIIGTSFTCKYAMIGASS